jgi:hypothetical protein
MPVVKKKSNWHGDKVDPARQRGRMVVAAGVVTNAADDSENSSYYLCDLPSDCIPDVSTAFQVQNWGFAAIRIGTRSDVDALAAVLKSAGNVVSPVGQFEDRPLWQVLGLAADPGGNIGLFAHAIAGATGAGTMLFRVAYRYR